MVIRIQKSKRLPLKNKAARDVLDRLNAYLNTAEPELIYWLTRLWSRHQKAVTYAELREAILNGYISEKVLYDWQQSYIDFVNEKLKLKWLNAAREGAKQIESTHSGFLFDPMSQGFKSWVEEYGAQWVANVIADAREAMSTMIMQAYSRQWTVDELAKAIRPIIGLTKQQAAANLKYYSHIKESLLKKEPTMRETTAKNRAKEAALKYAAKQHRQRAHTLSLIHI